MCIEPCGRTDCAHRGCLAGTGEVHSSHRVRLGTRFNYDLQRQEIRLEDGWHPVCQLAPAKAAALIWEQEQEAARHKASMVVQTREAELERENHTLRCERDTWMASYDRRNVENRALRDMIQPMTNREGELLAEITRLKAQLWLPREVGDHDYVGPVKDGEAVPDPVHERFHGSIGDVLAGRVIPEARRQMQEALKNAPKEKPTIRTGSQDDPRRIGWRV